MHIRTNEKVYVKKIQTDFSLMFYTHISDALLFSEKISRHYNELEHKVLYIPLLCEVFVILFTPLTDTYS